MKEKAEAKLKRAHIRLLKNRLTAPYIGAILLGESKIRAASDKEMSVPTAFTDGVNKTYCREWVDAQSIQSMCGGVLHENLHVQLKHILRHRDLMKDDPVLANASFDFVTNDIIMMIHEQNKELVSLPEHGLWDKKFRNWSVREVYNFLKTGKNNQGQCEGKPQRGEGKVKIGGHEYATGGHDGHVDGMADATPEQIQKIIKDIDSALQQSGLLAGRMGLEIPRSFKDAMEPEVDWADETRDFISTHTRGADEYTYRKYNKRRVVDEFYMPSTESEKVAEIIVGIDTSGSIGDAQLGEFAGELYGICELCQPERVRVLWWDTRVAGEQIFVPEQFTQIKNLLRAKGGGGTEVGSVSKHVIKNKLDADCLIIFTDGYVEQPVTWETKIPTLWLVTQNASFNPPIGKVVKFKSKV